AAREIGDDEAKAPAEELEDVTPRVARGHQAVNEEERLTRAVLSVVNANLSEGRRVHVERSRARLEVAVGAPRRVRQLVEGESLKGLRHGASEGDPYTTGARQRRDAGVAFLALAFENPRGWWRWSPTSVAR